MKKVKVHKSKMSVKVGDTVQVITGNEKGKIGVIKGTFRKSGLILVKDVNIRIKHIAPKRTNETGTRKQLEFPIHSSNVKKITQ